jgi:hypothetical protein
MRLHLPNIGERVTNAGASLALAVAYFLFALMFLAMIADTILAIARTW